MSGSDSIRLDLGCGRKCRMGFVGVDRLPLPGVSVVHDLNDLPYPFEENSVSEFWLDNVLEHVDEPIRVLEEIWRIGVDRAPVTVSVPYFRSLYSAIDPTHKHQFSVQYFDYFDPSKEFFDRYSYTSVRFAIERRLFDREWAGKRKGVVHRTILRYANRFPQHYERTFSHLYPLNSLTFYLRIDKSQ